MLIMAAAAAPEIRALRRYAIGRSIEHFESACTDQTGFLLRDFRADALTRQDVRRQNDAALRAGPSKARQAVAAID